MTPERIAEIRTRLSMTGISFQDMRPVLDALESAQKEIADLKRGGVVVPKMPENERGAILLMANNAFAKSGDTELVFSQVLDDTLGWVKARARAIPADRELGEGEVAVDRGIIKKFASGCGEWMPGLGRCGDQYPGGERQLCAKCRPLRDALRAQPTQDATP